MRIKSGVLFPISILLILGSLSPQDAKAKIPPPTLVDLIKNSNCIAEGKVTGISEVSGVRIAHLEVIRIHKGTGSLKRLNIWASRTWSCDISYAVLNESGLYFLTLSNKRNFEPRLAEELDRVLGGDEPYWITWSGYGRLINNDNGSLKAVGYVRFPRAISVRHVSTGDYSSSAVIDERDLMWVIHTMRPKTGD